KDRRNRGSVFRKGYEGMATNQLHRPQARTSKRRRLLAKFGHNVAAKLAATMIWKLGLVVLAIVIGAGAFAAVKRHEGAAAHSVSTGVVLSKLTKLNEFHAARADYNFNFTYVVHKGFLFFTGESIQVAGTGTDDAIVDFSQVDVTKQ